MKVAIVHPWFLALGGAEQAVGVIAELYPDADIFSLFCDRGGLPHQLAHRRITTSAFNFLPGKYHFYRQLMPFYPAAFEAIDLHGYDLVISSDSGVVKGILIDEGATHVCYCYSPMRALYDQYRDYLRTLPFYARPIFRWSSRHLRVWDYVAAQHVTGFATISHHIADRIRTCYGQESHVVYAPVHSQEGYVEPKNDGYYLSVGRLVRAKRLDILIEACNRLRRRLIVAGSGRELNALKRIAGPTIEFVEKVPASQLQSLYARSRAVLFAAHEDFGIVPVEAQSYGRPVIAYGRGGALETIIPGVTGLHFEEQTPDSLADAILTFEANPQCFDPARIRAHALTFDTAVFKRRFSRFVKLCIDAKQSGRHWTTVADALCEADVEEQQLV